jgi:hypothetical protein
VTKIILRRFIRVGILLAAATFAVRPEAALAQSISDPLGDFLPTYTGPHDPGLDVLSHEVRLAGDRLIFSARMAGPIAPTLAIGGVYATGLDRGQGAPLLTGPPDAPPIIGPNVLFDSVLAIFPNGTGIFDNIFSGAPPIPLNPADITISGNEYVANLPLSIFLPLATSPPGEWTYNLWPRNGAGLNVQVSDLAPDDGNSAVIPEPSSLALACLSALGLFGCGCRRTLARAR